MLLLSPIFCHRLLVSVVIVIRQLEEGRAVFFEEALCDKVDLLVVGQKALLQKLIALALFLLRKVRFAELFGAVGIVQSDSLKLLAREIEHAVVDRVEAMEIAVTERHAEHLPVVNILHQKCRD